MTLQDFADKHNLTIGSFADGSDVRFLLVWNNDKNIAEAWHLSDYILTSRAGSTLWFSPRGNSNV